MPDFETVKDFILTLAEWSDRPSGVALDLIEDASVVFGERHGSWCLIRSWAADGLTRSAQIAVTNAEAIADDRATNVILSVRAGASTEQNFVLETIFEKRRAIGRLDSNSVLELFESAVARADGYNAASLTDAYVTPVRRQLSA